MDTDHGFKTLVGKSWERGDYEVAVAVYERRFPKEMEILRLGGVYPSDTQSVKNPYTGEIDTEYFGNVGEHCLAVARCAEIFASSILGSHEQQTIDIIIRRALVHDASKRFEVMRRKAIQRGGIEGAYSYGVYETLHPVLESQGVSTEMIEYMSKAGMETGYLSLKDFILLEDGLPKLNRQSNLSEMIVHIADDMTYTPITKPGESAETQYVTFAERVVLANFPQRYPFMYTEGFGFTKGAEVELVSDIHTEDLGIGHVKSYVEWQAWVAKEISSYLVEKIFSKSAGKEPERVLKNILNSSKKSPE